MGESTVLNKLIAMDNVSCLADKSVSFVNFLAKFSFNCVYVFHKIYPTRSNWQMILSQTFSLALYTPRL